MSEDRHRLAPEYPAGGEVGYAGGRIDDPGLIRDSYQVYLRDESRLPGEPPRRIYFPASTLEVSAAVEEIRARGERLTISGARTGIVGGAANHGAENILSLERLCPPPRLERRAGSGGDPGGWLLRVGAGLTHARLLEFLGAANAGGSGGEGGRVPGRGGRGGTPPAQPASPLFYPVDPTELSASLGGNAATDASGARTLHYGSTRRWLEGLTVVLADGGVLRLRRGERLAREGWFELGRRGGRFERLRLEPVRVPATKHVAGYPLREDMDLIDLFIGSEGTLGIVTELELRLLEQEGERLYLCLFLPEATEVGELVRQLKAAGAGGPAGGAASAGSRAAPAGGPFALLALEYMDGASLELLRGYRREAGDASGVPALPPEARGALYLEAAYAGQEALEEATARLGGLLAGYGLSLEDSWAGFDEESRERMKRFRHALPERINSIIGRRQRGMPGLTKVSTDMAVPDEALPAMLETYRGALAGAGLEHAIFGHIGNGHLHVNVLPRSPRELAAARELYGLFARRAVELGGSVSGEHGIGRLKKDFLRIQYSEEELRRLRAVKDFLDPEGRLNPGVLF